jgi:(1->4)-alpha-D-glucan 1-alpha-D-glucosylmutase
LAQTLLKLTVPGVPDIYQGTELWDFSLVDPDNRRPVDFAMRPAGVDAGPVGDLAKSWSSGRIKQALISQTLALRRARQGLFTDGSYQPLVVSGKHAERVIAFARRFDADIAIAVVPRTVFDLLSPGAIAFQPGAWEDTAVTLIGDRAFISIFGGPESDPGRVGLGRLFDQAPFALLVTPAMNQPPRNKR